MQERKVGVRSACSAALLMSLLLSASAWGYEKEINALSAAMAEKIASKGKKTVAVVDFTDLEGNVTQLDRFVSEEFSVALAGTGKGFRVIDRTHLKSIIKEHKLSATGLIDPETARKLGKIAGVDALVTGTLTPFGDNVRVAVKILDAETAEVVDSATGNIAKTQAIDELLGKAIEHASPEEAKTPAVRPAQVRKEKAVGGFFADDFNAGPKPDWKPIAGNWTMANGQYTVTDVKDEETYIAFLAGKEWSNFVLSVDASPGHIRNDTLKMNICPRMVTQNERVCFGMSGNNHRFKEAYWLVIKDGASGEPVSRVPMETAEGQAVHVEIEAKNGVFTASVNGTQINQLYDATFPAGSIGLLQWYDWWGKPKIRMAFDNIEVKPLAE